MTWEIGDLFCDLFVNGELKSRVFVDSREAFLFSADFGLFGGGVDVIKYNYTDQDKTMEDIITTLEDWGK